MKQKFISEIITVDEVRTWKHKDIFIVSGTGTGKSRFSKNILTEIVKENDSKILILLPRVITVCQFKEEIEEESKSKYIDVCTYQSLESADSAKVKEKLAQYEYIVLDEAHYFLSDARYNEFTDMSLNAILSADATRVYLTATPEYIMPYLEERGIEFQKYIFDYRQKLNKPMYYRDEKTLEHLIELVVESWKCGTSGNKAILFCDDLKTAYKLYKRYKDYSMFYCSGDNPQYSKYRDMELIQEMVETQKMPKPILITTSALETGFNIIDEDLHEIFIYKIYDICKIIQCIGRKRMKHDLDTLSVHVYIPTNKDLRLIVASLKHHIQVADDYKTLELTEFFQKYPRKSDTAILYDCTHDGITVSKDVNELMLFKYKIDLKEIQRYIQINNTSKDSQCGICYVLDEKLGFVFDSSTDVWEKQEDEELREYLDSVYKRKIVWLSADDRTEFIAKVGIKRKSKFVRSKNSLNKIFEEDFKLPYRIEEFATHKCGVRYGHAWRITRV